MSETTTLFLEVVSGLNEGYRDLIRMYNIGDTKAGYLKAFEMCLSPACPSRQLWQFDSYRETERLIPLPDDPCEKVNPEVFRLWIVTYEQIMREVALIDKKPLPEEMDEMIEDIDLIDPFEEAAS